MGFGELGLPKTSALEGESKDWGVFAFEVFGEGTN
jgi:hypothetical protein